MKKTSSSWIQRRHRDQPPSIDTSSDDWGVSRYHQVPLSPTYISPRAAPEPPPLHSQKPNSSSLKGIQSVFVRKPSVLRTGSTTSLHSGFSASGSSHSHSGESGIAHPYSNMAPAPLPVVSSHDATEDEDECPVCLEPLSFSFRLPGEKPHIVPECGHALHEVSVVSDQAYEILLGCDRCPIKVAYFVFPGIF